MKIDFYGMRGDNIFILGDKARGYGITIYSDEDVCLTYDELKNLANTILAELEKEGK